nr:MAG TPA: hypothetical protein [Bacteriophage sp.]
MRRGRQGRNPREMKARHKVRNGGCGKNVSPTAMQTDATRKRK